ncbi:MAG: hypothetical protein A2511_14875 [Deltaproteobacteria bacterium RIFOXYD12_FULL_50_9]|nr:MAG: hypothetical protein A2511_14875 [Deltaproteobacteria bacterium RIFOXYD12_FULL_50_9]
MTTQERLRFIDACAEIGAIAESNNLYTFGLSDCIANTGKSFEELTVRELVILHQDYKKLFNFIYS